jgi:hypothetical protein
VVGHEGDCVLRPDSFDAVVDQNADLAFLVVVVLLLTGRL